MKVTIDSRKAKPRDAMSDRPKILCIEDNPATIELLVEVLKDEGFEPIVATDGVEGVRKLAEQPDVILCDVDMPQMSADRRCVDQS